MGLGYAKDIRKHSVEMLVAARMQSGPFHSVEDLALRVPSLNRKELVLLAYIGALNQLDGVEHRRDALWQVSRAGRLEGSLLAQSSKLLQEDAQTIPLNEMSTGERLVADYAGTGLTVGKHPMSYRRFELRRQGVKSAKELTMCMDGEWVRTAGCVIARQRPGTAKGFIFISMEDETGIANLIVTPDLYERQRLLVTRSRFLMVEGLLQNQDGVIHVKATHLMEIADGSLATTSHDFH
jgi:error-prone DNA polymerase